MPLQGESISALAFGMLEVLKRIIKVDAHQNSG